MTSKRTLGLCVGTLALLAWAAPATASPDYPAALRAATGAPCPPPCTVCHLTMNGGAGTAVKPFAEAMIAEGLDGEDESLVKSAAAKLKAAPVDSDGDGMDDIAELAAGRDPNVSGAGDLCGPEYGCGARVEPSGALDGHALVLALGVALVLGARIRRRAAAARR